MTPSVSWRAAVALGLTVSTLGASASCLWVRDLDALAKDTATLADASTDGTGTGTDAGPTDASTAAGDAALLADGGCPSLAGPTMVRIPDTDYCVDSTEVTYAHYAAFTAAADASAPQRAECAWNQNFDVESSMTNAPDNHPVRGIDWCDAVAYCAWAGKRLCGKIGGGALDPVTEVANADKSQWFRACSKNATLLYPYGNDYEPGRCNGGDGPIVDADIERVGTRASCVGGYPGLLDMAGNVREWEDSCEATDPPEARNCRNRGGGFYDVKGTLWCANEQFNRADFRNSGIGIRCCSQ